MDQDFFLEYSHNLGLGITKDDAPRFLFLLGSMCNLVLFARRQNTATQGSNVSDTIVGHSTGQIKHTNVMEISVPPNK